jgi:tetratricopeptide (TPR) repeat protein
MGKTWLLRSCPMILQDIASDLLIARIVDFYDYENRTPDTIELKLIEGLKKTIGQWYRLEPEKVEEVFQDYRRIYTGYIRTRERGASSQGDYTPAKLRETFITCWNKLAETHPMMIRFDTIETLYSPPAPPEALISTAAASTGAELILGWIKHVLPHLKHTLVLFSGRPLLYQEEGRHPFVETLEEQKLLVEPVHTLHPFEDAAVISEYLAAHDVTVSESDIPYLKDITEGRPLLLTCYAETRRPEMGLPPRLPMRGAATARREFEIELIHTILDPLIRPDSTESTLVHCLHFLSYARRGIRREQICDLFKLMELEYDERVIEKLHQVALVKEARTEPSVDRTEGQLLLLHDEIHLLIDQSGLAGELGYKELTLEYLAGASKEQVAKHKQSIERTSLLKAMSNHMYYALTYDIVSGYRFYVVYMDWLLNERSVDEALVISDAFWSIFNYRVQRNGTEVQPYREALAQIEGRLTYDQIIHDEQVDQVQMLLAQDKNGEAAQLAETLYQEFVERGVLPPGDQELSAENLPQDQYLFVELSIWWAQALNMAKLSGGAQRAERLFARAIQFLETEEWLQDEFLRMRRLYFLGIAYTRRGYLQRRLQYFYDAITYYERARTAFRNYRDDLVEYEGQMTTLEVLLNDHSSNDLAQVMNNLAFNLSNAGYFKRALRLSEEILRQYAPLSSDYQKALFYNVNARIRIGRDDYQGAESPLGRAEKAAQDSGVNRARGLVARTRGQLERAKMIDRGEPDAESSVYYEQAAEWLKNERETLREIYYDWSGFLRDVAVLYRMKQMDREAESYEQNSLKLLDRAMELLPPEESMQHADHLESKVVLFRIMGAYDQACTLLDEAENILHRVDVPEYGQVVCGKIALQRALIALYRDQDYQTCLLQMAIALARAYVFAKSHHDQAAFERVIRQHLLMIPVEDLLTFEQETGSEHLYPLAKELPYHKPDDEEWADAWEDSIDLINRLINELGKKKYP